MRAALTVDVEPDCPPYLTSFRGIDEGLPRLLTVLREAGVSATFFMTGEVARRSPEMVRSAVDRGPRTRLSRGHASELRTVGRRRSAP
jgi:peptidoglycan/xylan/chitin deacetylase (PgdA/CDA1 family)